MFIFSFFSQSLQPKPIANPPQVPVLSGAQKCPKSKKKHCDSTKSLNLALEEVSSYLEATITSKDNTDNPRVKKASKRKSSEEQTISSKMNAPKIANPSLEQERCDAKDIVDNSKVEKVVNRKTSENNDSNPPIRKRKLENATGSETGSAIGSATGSATGVTFISATENETGSDSSKGKEGSNTNSTQGIPEESYEDKRLRNIDERKAKFDELKLKSFKLSTSKSAPNPYFKHQKKSNPPISKKRKKSQNTNVSLKGKKDKNSNAEQVINDPQTSKSGEIEATKTAPNPYYKGRLPNLETKLKGVISEKKRDELKIRHYVQKTISKLYICPVCNKPDYDGGILWIQCDVCNKWYHYECVGIDKNFHQSEKAKDWFCDDCSV